MTDTADVTKGRHHPAQCVCVLCQVYRTSKPYDKAAQVYYRFLHDTPEGADHIGSARYIPRASVLRMRRAVIGPKPEQSSTVYTWNIAGVAGEETLEVPTHLTMSDPV